MSPLDRRARVRVWLASQGMTQADLAQQVGVTKGHISYVLIGKRDASPELAATLAKITGIAAKVFRS